ncbi:hypothetical protein VNO77_24453 [Canavalia gladiata]|uniref:Protein BREAKING OF ASYMMETRY IN THE STOMATAL LINEAGE n=1 Tax=Canavalia gladiata TaxID=3824 RepID=A0AAN9L9P8_CANGL
MSIMTRLLRWSVRDWASCFSACTLPLDDHEVTSTPQVAVKNMAFDKKNEKSFNSICKNNISRADKKYNKKRQLKNPIMEDKLEGVPSGNRFDHSSWSLSTDEDYIVFCFGEDGSVDVVKDDNSETLPRDLDGMQKNSTPVHGKVKYGENVDQVSGHNIHEIRSNANQQNNDEEVQCHYPGNCLQEEEKEMVHMDKERSDTIRRACQVVGIKDQGMVSAKSRDSDQSEGSRGSFAFPVLGWDWIGSPVQMPKSEGFHLRKHKAPSVRFHCYRF